MRLDALPRQPSDEVLIRLFDFTAAEARELQSAVEALAEWKLDGVAVHELPFIAPIGGSRLILRVTMCDQSLIDSGGSRPFECRLTPGSWDNVAGLIEPFTREADGFQWLAGGPEASGLLLTVDGSW